MTAESAPPQKLGQYKIQNEVGTGGLGKVYKALDERSGETVAVKVLHERYSTNKRFLGIFHRELLIMSRLHHKHIVSYLDSCFEPPECFIVTEFVEGWSGYKFIKQQQRIPPIVALCILIDILQGIDYLHLHDIVHSDLSAPNFLIDRSGRVKVTDFGLSCHLDVENYKNYMVGTPGYYSPEHVTPTAMGPATDIYNAGLLLYEMVVGKKAVKSTPDREEVISGMKRIDFGLVKADDRKLQSMLRRLLKDSLVFSISRRIGTSEAMMLRVYEILKKYQIRYARHAIRQYLIDCKMTPGLFSGEEQDIYVGYLGS